MQEVCFSALAKQDFQVLDLAAFALSRQSGEWYRYQSAPRENHGFLYLLCDVTFAVDGITFTANRGDVVLLPAGSQYIATVSHPLDTVGFMLNFQLATASGKALSLSDAACVLSCDNPDTLTLFEQAQTAYTQLVYPAAMLKSAWYTLFSALHPSTEPTASPMDAAVNYIDTHLHEKLQVSSLAKQTGLSETTFRTAFKTITGESPNQYIVRRRIEKAMLLLADNELALNDAAQMLCFYDTAFFCKVFKNHTGLTPKQYRAGNSPTVAPSQAAPTRSQSATPTKKRTATTRAKPTHKQQPSTKKPQTATYTRILDELPTALL